MAIRIGFLLKDKHVFPCNPSKERQLYPARELSCAPVELRLDQKHDIAM